MSVLRNGFRPRPTSVSWRYDLLRDRFMLAHRRPQTARLVRDPAGAAIAARPHGAQPAPTHSRGTRSDGPKITKLPPGDMRDGRSRNFKRAVIPALSSGGQRGCGCQAGVRLWARPSKFRCDRDVVETSRTPCDNMISSVLTYDHEEISILAPDLDVSREHRADGCADHGFEIRGSADAPTRQVDGLISDNSSTPRSTVSQEACRNSGRTISFAQKSAFSRWRRQRRHKAPNDIMALFG